jgi:hypothetical protein
MHTPFYFKTQKHVDNWIPRHKWEDNINLDLKERESEVVT